MSMSITREQALAFRLGNQNLVERLPADHALNAAGVSGLQNTPPGSAELAFHARVLGQEEGAVRQSLEERKDLLQLWCLRASPYVILTRDLAVFSTGLLPESEEELRAFLPGVVPALEKISISAQRTLALAVEQLDEVLAGTRLTKDELGRQLSDSILPHLDRTQQELWSQPSPYASRQHLGESVARFFLPVLALQRRLCHAERVGSTAYYRRIVDWLPVPPPSTAKNHARAEMVRRFLHCYGPANADGFARWVGISRRQAEESWQLVLHDLAEVQYREKSQWVHADDLPLLAAPGQASGARLLPPHDPLLASPDREGLIPEARLRRRTWRTAGSPGLVLVRGQPGGLWRAQKKGQRQVVQVELFSDVDHTDRTEIAAEAEGLARFWKVDRVEVSFCEVS